MIRSIAASALIFLLASYLSYTLWGYDRGGRTYLNRQREQRRSLRVGSHSGVYYSGGPYSTRGPRFGK